MPDPSPTDRGRAPGPSLRAIAIGAVWAAIAACAAWALVRSLGLEAGYPAVALIAFTPYVALVAALLVPASFALRRRIAAGVALASAAALALAVAPRALPDPAPPVPGGSELTVMTANLKRGTADPARVVELVGARRVDALSIQELTPGAARGLRRAGLERLLPDRALLPRSGAQGMGVYTRRRSRPLPGSSPAMKGASPVRIRPPGAGPVDLVPVHPRPPLGGWNAERWQGELDGLAGRETGGPPGILFGDFNATLDHEAMRRILDAGYVDAADAVGQGLVPTWRGTGRPIPPVTIDHVLVDPRIAVREVSVDELDVSDHRAVTAVLEVPAGRP